MSITRQLRVSEYKDYVAVDLVDGQGKIHSTVCNVTPAGGQKAKTFDFEEEVWRECTLTLKPNGEIRVVEDGFEWDARPKDLLDNSQFMF